MTELDEKIDNWLIAKDFPTSVPYEMKLLAFIGEKSMPRKKGAPKKPISNNARRAMIFLAAEQMFDRQKLCSHLNS